MKKSIANNAIDRLDIALEAFREGYVHVDEYTREELMTFAVEFSSLIKYYNGLNKDDGDWVGFYLTDEAFLLAYIACTDIKSIEREFEDTFLFTQRACHLHAKFEALKRLFNQIFMLARKFNLFLMVFSRWNSSDESVIKKQVEEIIQLTLSHALRKLKAYSEGAAAHVALDRKIPLNVKGFMQEWKLRDVKPDHSIYAGPTLVKKIDCSLRAIKPLFEIFVEQLEYVKKSAIALLPEALARQHQPHAALYLAFIELYQTSRKSINTITGRYKNFYYRDILRQQVKPYEPDSVYLALKLADEEGLEKSQVPKNTLFLGGTDENGNSIAYSSDQDLWVSKASLQAVYTLFTQRGPLIHFNDPVTERICGCPPLNLDTVTGIFSGDYLKPTDEGKFALPDKGFKTLGSAQATSFNTDARIGFVIASTNLFLSNGDRHISFDFHLTEESTAIIFRYLDELSAITGNERNKLLKRILHESFEISLSTSDQWLTIEKYSIHCEWSLNQSAIGFKISLDVPLLAPAITNFQTEVTDGIDASLPCARFIMRNKAMYFEEMPGLFINPLSFISVVNIERITLDVHVERMVASHLYNSFSAVDPSSPFNLFGPVPVQGSFFDIKEEELFKKKVASLKVVIDWYDLPKNNDGFRGYYRGYIKGLNNESIKIQNDKFKVDILIDKPGRWIISDSNSSSKLHYLFHTKQLISELVLCMGPPSPDSELCNKTKFDDLNITSANPPACYSALDSAIRIRLKEPRYAFGNDLYAANVLNAVIEDLPNAELCKLKCEERCKDSKDYELCIKQCMTKCLTPKEMSLPNPPYVPTATSVQIEYKSESEVTWNTDDSYGDHFYQVLPFNGFVRKREKGSALLPQFHNGNLMLGFSGMTGEQSLSMLFEMSDEANRRSETHPPICWSYLSENRWVMLRPTDVLADSTNGFMHTGISKVKIPSFSEENNTVLSSGLKWLRATATNDADAVATTNGIYLHSLLATWQNNDNTQAHLQNRLPKFTITEPLVALPDIGEILQPMPSFAGWPGETSEQLDIRVGERLRHKQRAILPWDYERLVLQRFPEIYKVKCLAHHTLIKSVAPGHVLVVVVPGQNALAKTQQEVPVADTGLLSKVQDYLRKMVSPFVKIQVCNPEYVRIQVNCTVAWNEPEEAGELRNRLEQDLIGYLSPWFHDGDSEKTKGEYISESEISAFIQNRAYVSFLERLELDYQPLPETLITSFYFLTSAKHHLIHEVEEKMCKLTS